MSIPIWLPGSESPTLTSTTWRNDTMGSGTPFSITHGDRIAVCFHLTITSGTPSVKVRSQSATYLFPTGTLFTSPSTYAAQSFISNFILTFSDGTTIGWLEGSFIESAAATAESIGGSGNYYGNIFRLPYACEVDAILGAFGSTTTTNSDFGIYQDNDTVPDPAVANWTGLEAVDANSVVSHPPPAERDRSSLRCRIWSTCLRPSH